MIDLFIVTKTLTLKSGRRINIYRAGYGYYFRLLASNFNRKEAARLLAEHFADMKNIKFTTAEIAEIYGAVIEFNSPKIIKSNDKKEIPTSKEIEEYLANSVESVTFFLMRYFRKTKDEVLKGFTWIDAVRIIEEIRKERADNFADLAAAGSTDPLKYYNALMDIKECDISDLDDEEFGEPGEENE